MSFSPAGVIPFRKNAAAPNSDFPNLVVRYPEFRYMGSKRRLLPWIFDVLSSLDFDSAWDPFSGSGCVAYLMKAMGKRVITSDFLNFPTVIARALVENPGKRLDGKTIVHLLKRTGQGHDFISRTFKGIFFTPSDLSFLDAVSGNLRQIEDPHLSAVAMTALLRSCLKKQPRGVFTVTGNLDRYDDGRRDLRLSLEEHFLEQIESINAACFDNGRRNQASHSDVFKTPVPRVDLVYLDPPYVPRSDDNCYIKRYHFLEGLSCYWQGLEIDYSTKTRKIAKQYTPFSYRSQAIEAFDRLFRLLRSKTIVLSYSSNGFPDQSILLELMGKHKKRVDVFSRAHRYHFGTHDAVKRAETTEYLIVGS